MCVVYFKVLSRHLIGGTEENGKLVQECDISQEGPL
jgi:hypothetical protein